MSQDGFAEYEICSVNRTSSIRVIPECGGVITGFNVLGKELLYLNRELFKKDIRAGGIPVLFPVCGGLEQDIYKYKGKDYHMPSHGFAWALPWEVAEDSKLTSGKITLRLSHGKETLKQYPFKFEVISEYCVYDDSLVITQTCRNTGKEAMPFYTGYHPYFAVGDKNGLEFDIDAHTYMDFTDGKTYEYTGNVDFSKEVDFVFPLEPKKNYLSRMKDPDLHHTIEIQTSKEFGAFVLWTEKDRNFICTEPWMAGPNAMNTGKGLMLIPAGDEIRTWIKIQVKGEKV